MLQDWSPTTVSVVRAAKSFFGLFSGTTFCGVPLDWPLRFGLLGGLYLLLTRRSRRGGVAPASRRRATMLCLGLLAVTELMEIVATRTPGKFYWPDIGDAADLLAGLAGIASAAVVRRIWLHRKSCELEAISSEL